MCCAFTNSCNAKQEWIPTNFNSTKIKHKNDAL